ncbi:DUF2946 family protein [Modicisalibacter ilicicola]|uniref:DUF2946 family protein n=1 Tax=Modicisalibacter ilicicola TaxID=480814 RepID=UPI000932C318
MLRLSSRKSLHHYFAAYLALAAMAIVFLGPLISQVQAGDRHDSSMAGMSHAGMPDHAAPVNPQAEVALTWFDQCGYCSFWQHFPTAHVVTPKVARDAFKPSDGEVACPRPSAVCSPSFPSALARAPPISL